MDITDVQHILAIAKSSSDSLAADVTFWPSWEPVEVLNTLLAYTTRLMDINQYQVFQVYQCLSKWLDMNAKLPTTATISLCIGIKPNGIDLDDTVVLSLKKDCRFSDRILPQVRYRKILILSTTISQRNTICCTLLDAGTVPWASIIAQFDEN